MKERTVNHINFKLPLSYLFILLMFSGINSENANDPENSQRRRSGGGCIELILGTGGVGAAKSCTEHGSSKFDLEQKMRREKLEKELSPYSEEIKKSNEEWHRRMEEIENKHWDYIIKQDEIKRRELIREEAKNIATEIFLNEITKKEVGDINFLIAEFPWLKKYFYSSLTPEDFSKSKEKSNIIGAIVINRLSDIGIDFINEESRLKRVDMVNEFIKIKEYEEEYMKMIAHDTVSDLISHLNDRKRLTSRIIDNEIYKLNKENTGYSMLSLSFDGFYFHVNVRVAKKYHILNMYTDLLGVTASGIASAVTYQVVKTTFSPPPNRYRKMSCLSCHSYSYKPNYIYNDDVIVSRQIEDEDEKTRKKALNIAYDLVFYLKNKKIKKNIVDKAIKNINKKYKNSVLSQPYKGKLSTFDIIITKNNYVLNMRFEFIESNNGKFSSNLKLTEMSFSNNNNLIKDKSCLSCHFYNMLRASN